MAEAEREEEWRTKTNSGDDSSGVAFGLEGDLFIPVALGAFTTVTLFSFLLLTGWVSFLAASIWSSLPVLGAASYVLLLRHKKPKHYDVDLFEEIVTGDDGCRRLTRQPTHPYLEAEKIDTQAKARVNQR